MPQGLPGPALLSTLPHDPAQGPACARACGGASGHSAVTFLRSPAAMAAQTPRDACVIWARGLSGSTGIPGNLQGHAAPLTGPCQDVETVSSPGYLQTSRGLRLTPGLERGVTTAWCAVSTQNPSSGTTSPTVGNQSPVHRP